MLSGADIRAQLTVDRAAVDNWARLTGAPQTSLAERRLALLETIEAQGVLLDGPPAWMTSPRPGVDRWLALPDAVVLALVDDPGERPWRAQNALAPRRGRTRVIAPPAPSAKAAMPSALRTWAQDAPLDQVLASVRASAHVVDRLAERAGVRVESTDAVVPWLTGQDVCVAEAPVWADGAGGRGLVLLVGDELALTLAADDLPDTPTRLVLTSAMSRAWAQADLDGARVTFSRKVTRALWPQMEDTAAAARAAQELGDLQLARGGATGSVAGRRVQIRPVRGGWVAQRLLD